MPKDQTIYEKLKPFLKDYLMEYYGLNESTISKPFRCLNPDHTDVHPSMVFQSKKNVVHCFSCGMKYDIVYLAMMKQGFSSLGEAAEWLKSKYLGGDRSLKASTSAVNAPLSPTNETRGEFIYPSDFEPTIAYLSAERGFKQAEWVAKTYHLVSDGKRIYFPHRLSESLGGMEERESWQARAIREKSHSERYQRAKGSRASFYCPSLNVFLEASPRKKLFLFLEGEIDCLSFEDMRRNGDIAQGGESMIIPVATSSTSNVTADRNGLLCSFLDEIEEKRGDGTEYGFILGFDADRSGREATEIAKAVLSGRGFKYVSKPFLAGKSKDMNESMKADREATAKALEEISDKFDALACEEKKRTLEEYILAHSAKGEMESLFSPLGEEDPNPVRTHYGALDDVLDGEISGGSVVTIGAMSSVGKTTFLLQMAEQMAIEEERDILYFNLEQSSKDLIAKSLSRLTFILDTKGRTAVESSDLAKTAVGISQGRRYRGYSKEEKALIEEAKGVYRAYADRLYFISPSVDEIGLSAKDIAEKVRKHIEATGHTPAVMVDYLQIMKPISKGQSDKEAVEQNFSALKSLASRYGLVVFLLCSVNRGSYGGFVDMASLKESGMIEYSSDYLLGLNYEQSRGISKPRDGKKSNDDRLAEESLRRAKGEPVSDLVVNVIKNRNGKTGEEIKFRYFKLFNAFVCNGMRSDLDRIFLKDAKRQAIISDDGLPF